MLNPKVLAAKACIGDPVRNLKGEHLGYIKDILFDRESIEVSFAVLDYNHGEKEFAVPYPLLNFIGEEGFFELNIQVKELVNCNTFLNYQFKNYYQLNFSNQ
jgi:hypothetical protein